MVAQTIELPNIRRLFIPDPGQLIAEVDLAGADAMVVAWEAEDEDLKEAFRKGLKLHIKNARDIFPDKTKDMSDEALKATDRAGGLYHNCKRAVHATNYGAKPRTIAMHTGWTVHESDMFQRNWFGLHPGIARWHDRTDEQLIATRSVANKFGYRIVYFDRVEHLLPGALAWVPQSTVAHVCIRGGIKLRKQIPWVQMLLQVHDSLIFQFPKEKYGEKEQILKTIETTVPYDDSLVIPWGLKISDKSWGHAMPTDWRDAA